MIALASNVKVKIPCDLKVFIDQTLHIGPHDLSLTEFASQNGDVLHNVKVFVDPSRSLFIR